MNNEQIPPLDNVEKHKEVTDLIKLTQGHFDAVSDATGRFPDHMSNEEVRNAALESLVLNHWAKALNINSDNFPDAMSPEDIRATLRENVFRSLIATLTDALVNNDQETTDKIRELLNLPDDFLA